MQSVLVHLWCQVHKFLAVLVYPVVVTMWIKFSIVTADPFSAYTYQSDLEQHQDYVLILFLVGRYHYHSRVQHEQDLNPHCVGFPLVNYLVPCLPYGNVNHEWRVQIHQLWVQIYEFNFRSYKFKSMSYEFKFTSSNPLVMSSNLWVTNSNPRVGKPNARVGKLKV